MNDERRVVKNNEPEDRFIVADNGTTLLVFKNQNVVVNAVYGKTAEEVIERGLVLLKEYLIHQVRNENHGVNIETGFCVGSAVKELNVEKDKNAAALREIDEKVKHLNMKFQHIIEKLEEKEEFPEV